MLVVMNFRELCRTEEMGMKKLGILVIFKIQLRQDLNILIYNGVRRIRVTTRGYADGDIEVRNEIDGEVLAKLHIVYTNVWEDYETEILLPDGVQPLYFTFRGQGNASLKSFTLLKEV